MLIAFGLDARLRSGNGKAAYSSLDEAFTAFYLEYFGSLNEIIQLAIGAPMASAGFF
jgi:hypothetical protein